LGEIELCGRRELDLGVHFCEGFKARVQALSRLARGARGSDLSKDFRWGADANVAREGLSRLLSEQVTLVRGDEDAASFSGGGCQVVKVG
jgi:hypothetical protein